ncbi:acyl-CoA synthetase (AMP-forming)/AMP-acid ligase II [Williamsia limnetica]|uniref:Acyl-CoA synthetase (AMP-forming)/AMP-acid ligase II n=1 Tax=Williamsia limnetica TaxID=882452 RepID=A0A318RGW7_WILLI|nr:AMP-binding protein [Williamsia limnetica]PYE16277.1 acyl-CoA synthetase (AMP-forming)/AMP-acid ligase II [Williamsia limnetica]
MRNMPVELTQHYERMGWWTPDSLGKMVAEGLHEHPDVTFRVHSAVRPYVGTFGDVEVVARRLAAGLQERGVGPGDVVVMQLPNWMEAAATFWASSFLGAVVVPMVHFYGPKELSFVLATTKPKVYITAARFGRMTYKPEVSADVPIVGVVGENGEHEAGFDELLADEPMQGTLAVDPAAPAVIAFTSGTTRDPKGVVHSHQTLGFETRQLLANYPADRGAQLTALPVGHFIGMVSALLTPILEGVSVDLLDQWDPGRVLELIDSHGVAIGGGPPYFVTSLLDQDTFRDDHLNFLKYMGLGGSAVPGTVARHLADLGICVTRSYGSTEHPSITGSLNSAPQDKRLYTDGMPRLGVEIRLGEDGEIFSRGPDLCIGYTDEALTENAFDSDGWYRTGDVGVLDEDGYLTITDRKSDLIIRGGENISAVEVEDVLLSMPAISEAVVVAASDVRLGEHAAAVMRVRPDHVPPTLDEVRVHFENAGMARQKWPEELFVVDELPRTASGKVQKYAVRQSIPTLRATVGTATESETVPG